jgi:hypothetical protein
LLSLRLKLILPVIAQAINSATPTIDFTDFIDEVKGFESRYTFWNECNTAFREINSLNDQIVPGLQEGKTILIQLTETDTTRINQFTSFLEKHNILRFERDGSVALVLEQGISYNCKFIPMPELQKTFHNPNFKL